MSTVQPFALEKKICTYYSNCVTDSSDSSYKYCDYAQYSCCGCSSPIDGPNNSLIVSGRNRFAIGTPSIQCFPGGTC